MKLLLFFVTFFSLFYSIYAADDCHNCKIVCFFNRKAFHRGSESKVTIDNLRLGIHMCSHFVYGYIGFGDGDKNYTLRFEDFDFTGEEFTSVLDLKLYNSQLKIFLCVGGYADEKKLNKYLSLLESPIYVKRFINQLQYIVNISGVDGIDLAWRFPTIDEKQEKSILGYTWDVGTEQYVNLKDSQKKFHRDKFTDMCNRIYSCFQRFNLMFTISVMPRINQQDYFNALKLSVVADYIHLMTFDYKTPVTNPKTGGFADPITFPRNYGENYSSAQLAMDWWMDNNMTASKLFLSLPTFGRTWVLADTKSIPPVKTLGPGIAGEYFKLNGSIAYYELCKKIVLNSNEVTNTTYLRLFNVNKVLGTCAYLRTQPENGIPNGTWISYPDPSYAALKARFVKLVKLAGVAIVDLSLDDFDNKCGRGLFPLLTATKLYI